MSTKSPRSPLGQTLLTRLNSLGGILSTLLLVVMLIGLVFALRYLEPPEEGKYKAALNALYLAPIPDPSLCAGVDPLAQGIIVRGQAEPFDPVADAWQQRLTYTNPDGDVISLFIYAATKAALDRYVGELDLCMEIIRFDAPLGLPVMDPDNATPVGAELIVDRLLMTVASELGLEDEELLLAYQGSPAAFIQAHNGDRATIERAAATAWSDFLAGPDAVWLEEPLRQRLQSDMPTLLAEFMQQPALFYQFVAVHPPDVVATLSADLGNVIIISQIEAIDGEAVRDYALTPRFPATSISPTAAVALASLVPPTTRSPTTVIPSLTPAPTLPPATPAPPQVVTVVVTPSIPPTITPTNTPSPTPTPVVAYSVQLQVIPEQDAPCPTTGYSASPAPYQYSEGSGEFTRFCLQILNMGTEPLSLTQIVWNVPYESLTVVPLQQTLAPNEPHFNFMGRQLYWDGTQTLTATVSALSPVSNDLITRTAQVAFVPIGFVTPTDTPTPTPTFTPTPNTPPPPDTPTPTPDNFSVDMRVVEGNDFTCPQAPASFAQLPTTYEWVTFGPAPSVTYCIRVTNLSLVAFDGLLQWQLLYNASASPQDVNLEPNEAMVFQTVESIPNLETTYYPTVFVTDGGEPGSLSDSVEIKPITLGIAPARPLPTYLTSAAPATQPDPLAAGNYVIYYILDPSLEGTLSYGDPHHYYYNGGTSATAQLWVDSDPNHAGARLNFRRPVQMGDVRPPTTQSRIFGGSTTRTQSVRRFAAEVSLINRDAGGRTSYTLIGAWTWRQP